MPQDITVENVKGLSSLEPFGAQNPSPVFAVVGAVVLSVIPLSQGKHTKIEFEYGSYKGQALFFSLAPERACFKIGDRIDMLVKLDINSFRGTESVSIKVIDHRLSGVKQERYFAAKQCYEKLMRGEDLPSAYVQKMIPDRNELVRVYKYINSASRTTLDHMFMSLGDDSMNYCKMRICVDIFADKQLVEYKPATMSISMLEVNSKVDLEDSPTLKKLRSML